MWKAFFSPSVCVCLCVCVSVGVCVVILFFLLTLSAQNWGGCGCHLCGAAWYSWFFWKCLFFVLSLSVPAFVHYLAKRLPSVRHEHGFPVDVWSAVQTDSQCHHYCVLPTAVHRPCSTKKPWLSGVLAVRCFWLWWNLSKTSQCAVVVHWPIFSSASPSVPVG